MAASLIVPVTVEILLKQRLRRRTIVADMVVSTPRLLILVAALGWLAVPASAQTKSATEPATVAAPVEKPLPDIPTLIREVEAHQKAAESIQKNYLYRSVVTEQESNGHGGIKKTSTREYDVFWIDGVPVSRLMKKDGKDLSEKEIQKENEEIDKRVAEVKEKKAKAMREGKATDSAGNEVVPVSRLLELLSFTNPRRVMLNGRDTIVMDCAGAPHAQPRDRAERVYRVIAGTAWVDEQDRALVKAEGRFVDSFKIGGGLVANIQKGTSFQMEQTKVNGEVWLPSMAAGSGSARFFLLFHFNGTLKMVNSGYRKFKATSTILPDIKVPASQ